MRNALLALAVVGGLSLFAVPAFAGGPGPGWHGGGHGGHGGHGGAYVVRRQSGYYVQPHVRSHYHVARPVPYCAPYAVPRYSYGYGGPGCGYGGYGNSGYFGVQGPNFGIGIGW